jgi:hypothetical protein
MFFVLLLSDNRFSDNIWYYFPTFFRPNIVTAEFVCKLQDSEVNIEGSKFHIPRITERLFSI